MNKLIIIALGLLINTAFGQSSSNTEQVTADAEVIILSSNLADSGTIGEWGFSALVKTQGHCILFDTGNYPDTVIRNAAALNVDLSCVSDVVISHFHADHTSGLLPLIASLNEQNTQPIEKVHVAKGIFQPRRRPGGSESATVNQMIGIRTELEKLGVAVVVHDSATEIYPSVWVTGPITRNHPEKNYNEAMQVSLNGSWEADFVPESQGLAVLTADGPIVLLGCGHSGVVNLLEQVQRSIQDKPIQALMGGMHLFEADDETLSWTEEKLKEIGLKNLMAGHCTGLEPLFRFRAGLGLTRKNAVVGAVGSRFVYGQGIHPGRIAQ